MTTDVFACRRQNLRLLIHQHQGVTELAKLLGYSSPSYLSQMAGPHPTRQVTEKVGRDIEQKLLLPSGWLDQPRDALGQTAQADDDKVQRVVLLVGQLLHETATSVTPEQFAGLVSLAYERNNPDETYIRRLIHIINPTSRK